MLIATFQLEPDALALAETLDRVPEITVEAERIAAHSTDWTMPCIWVSDADFDAVDEALGADPSIDSVVDSEIFDDEKYYQLDWSEDVQSRIDSYLDTEASMLKAEATDEGWTIRIRFVVRDQFDAFREHLHDRDDSFELLNLTEPKEPRPSHGDLTSVQREALRTAREQGYYSVPRDTTVRELATELDMSHQNLSELLRRGTGKLIDATLATTADDQ